MSLSIFYLFSLVSLVSLVSHMGRIIAPLPNPFIGDGVDPGPGCCGAQPTQPKEVFMFVISFIVLEPLKTPKGLICVVGIDLLSIISMI